MAAVELRGVTKSFGAVRALEPIDLAVDDGELVVLLGPSGCGKTTALRVVAGLEEPTAGDVLIGGMEVTDVAPKDRDVAMVFQNYALYPHMTVAENIGFSLRLAGKPQATIASEIEKAAAALGIRHLLARRPRELSGGQRQRVAVCRAIVRDPAVFLFDEPLSNLDARLRLTARAEIRTLQQRLRTTALYVTHDQAEAMTMADRIVVMSDGRIQQIGRPDQIYGRPANVFVAAFVGSPPMNLLPYVGGGDGVNVPGADGWSLPWPERPTIAATGTFGIRPEDVVIGGAANGGWGMQVELVEALGAETLVHLSRGAARLVARIPGRAPPRVGEAVDVRLAPDALHWFGETGMRLG
jgi:ABC-type sugar transport system ATPase subunit